MHFLASEKLQLPTRFSLSLLSLRSGCFHLTHCLLLNFFELLDSTNVASSIDEVEMSFSHRRVQDSRRTHFFVMAGTLYVLSVSID
ncbi:hypothetical protein D3C87_1360730 [compost metagenome]